ncbi:hypothetical protein MICAD_960006 [Microcystis aeruginosa PCC 7941]|nr:hypothetical protein MICAD_960006 [Microcystis aeruginosa PCC 7941]
MCTHYVHRVALFEKGYQQTTLLMFYQIKFLIWFKENAIHLQHPSKFYYFHLLLIIFLIKSFIFALVA